MDARSVAARLLRRGALVALILLAVVASPVALPIRILVARRVRPPQTTEQVLPSPGVRAARATG